MAHPANISDSLNVAELINHETPLKIIVSALEEISVNGLTSATTKNIAARAEMSTGIIHHYFDTKENLLFASFCYLVEDLRRNVVEIFAATTDPYERLRRMIRMNFNQVHVAERSRDAWPQLWAYATSDDRAARLVRIYYRRYKSNLQHCFSSIFDDEGRARSAATLLVAQLHGVWFTNRFGDLPADTDAAIALLDQQLELMINRLSAANAKTLPASQFQLAGNA